MRDVFKEIYFLNSKVKESERISVVGVEFDLPNAALLYLSYLVSESSHHKVPQAYNDLVKIVQNKGFSPYDDMRNEEIQGTFERLDDDINGNKLLYEEVLGETFFDLHHVVKSVLDGFSLLPLENVLADIDLMNIDVLEKRGRLSYQNFLKLYPRTGEGNFFGQFGYYHVYQRKTRFVHWFATHLAQYPFSGEVLSLVYIYENSYRLARCFGGHPSEIAPYNSSHLFTDFDKLSSISNSRAFLLPFIGDDSPFSRELHLIRLGSGGVTTDYFQFAVFIRKAEPERAYYECQSVLTKGSM